MDENIQSDILIEGEGLVAAMFSYFLSTKNQDKSINLVLRKRENINSTIYTPGSIFPIFKFPADLMEKVFHRTKEIIADLHSTTSYFEFYQNPYLVLYRDKNSIEQMSEHREKLAKTNIRNTNLSIEEIESYYPFINTTKEIYLSEIYNSSTCSNPYELFTTFLKLAVENDVKVINDNSEICISKDEKLVTEKVQYSAKDYLITTTVNQCSQSLIKKEKVLKVVTPILERFPRVSLYDIATASSMWLEEAGYFHILRSSKINSEKESINRVKKDFGELFSSIDSLEIIDSYHTEISICDSIDEWISIAPSKKMFHFNIPLHFELSAAPSVVKTFSYKLEKKEDMGTGFIPISSLY
jgi:hypothetical protein